VATVCFDFDSTLIDRESLDVILARRLGSDEEAAARVRAITDLGMAGRFSFRESMELRLAIAKPSREEATRFGEEAVGHLTPGMSELIAGLGAEAWIVSGGIEEALLPVATHLGIPRDRVLGTQVEWSADGEFGSLRRCGPKSEAVGRVYRSWSRPRIGVGDGMSDHALLEAGCVDHFIAFTEHARRDAVVATGVPEASNVSELKYLLERLL
jgi:phosphoserine phosphatase